MGVYLKIREKLRFNPVLYHAVWTVQSTYFAVFGRLVRDRALKQENVDDKGQVALCLRFREEGRYLHEWLEYYQAAGVAHFFLYNNFSTDNYLQVLQPYIDAGVVTLIDWPLIPASPAAEEDCIRRAHGRFRWVGFFDADEFVVIRDGRSIPEFLENFADHPGIGLHWRLFGSSSHCDRPDSSVIAAYTRRANRVNLHIKCFVRPEWAAQCRNSHFWFYRRMNAAVSEKGDRICGSLHIPASAEQAWINHYYCKSEEDYLEKARRKSTLDRVGIDFPSRRLENLSKAMRENNDVVDECASSYYETRCKLAGIEPVLLNSAVSNRPEHANE